MNQKLSRRCFVILGGGMAATFAGCGHEEPGSEATDQVHRSAATEPTACPAEMLSREEFFQYLDTLAEANMQRCHHCAQATFLSLRQGFGLPDGGILKALTPLPGIAERGETCGAVIGSLMALGLVFGRDQIEDATRWRTSLVPARSFCARFEEQLGSTQCGDLLEKHFGKRYDLADPLERAEFIGARPGPSEICGGVVRTAVRIAAELMLEEYRDE